MECVTNLVYTGNGPFWAELIDLHRYTKDTNYYNIIKEFGDGIQWESGALPNDVNEHCISATFCEMYELSADEKMTAKGRFMADIPINRRHEPTVKFKGNSNWIEW